MPGMARPAEVERLFRALADRTRLRLLNLMRDGEVCVCVFTHVLKTHQPKISRHLAYLRAAGLVETRRQGRWMHYRIAVPADAGLRIALRAAMAALDEQPLFRADRARMHSIACSPRSPVRLQGAPLPELAAAAARARA
jgi:ArsR family transcriptional regulator